MNAGSEPHEPDPPDRRRAYFVLCRCRRLTVIALGWLVLILVGLSSSNGFSALRLELFTQDDAAAGRLAACSTPSLAACS